MKRLLHLKQMKVLIELRFRGFLQYPNEIPVQYLNWTLVAFVYISFNTEFNCHTAKQGTVDDHRNKLLFLFPTRDMPKSY
jgi:hypothetical protein